MPENWRPPNFSKSHGEREQLKAALCKSCMFAELTSESMELILDAFQGPLRLEPGQLVIRQGAGVESGELGIFILSSGSLDVYRAEVGEERLGVQIHNYCELGQHFGELALLHNCPRSATVIAARESFVWGLDRETFNQCVKNEARTWHSRCSSFLAFVDILSCLSDDEREKIADVARPRLYAK